MRIKEGHLPDGVSQLPSVGVGLKVEDSMFIVRAKDEFSSKEAIPSRDRNRIVFQLLNIRSRLRVG